MPPHSVVSTYCMRRRLRRSFSPVRNSGRRANIPGMPAESPASAFKKRRAECQPWRVFFTRVRAMTCSGSGCMSLSYSPAVIRKNSKHNVLRPKCGVNRVNCVVCEEERQAVTVYEVRNRRERISPQVRLALYSGARRQHPHYQDGERSRASALIAPSIISLGKVPALPFPEFSLIPMAAPKAALIHYVRRNEPGPQWS